MIQGECNKMVKVLHRLGLMELVIRGMDLFKIKVIKVDKVFKVTFLRLTIMLSINQIPLQDHHGGVLQLNHKHLLRLAIFVLSLLNHKLINDHLIDLSRINREIYIMFLSTQMDNLSVNCKICI